MEQTLRRDVHVPRVTVVGFPVGERELGALYDGVDVFNGVVAHADEVEPGEQSELLEKYGSLAPQPCLAHRVAVVVQRRRSFQFRPVSGEIVAAQQASMASARGIHHPRRGHVMHDGLGDEAAVERVAGRLYLLVAISASRLGLFDDAPEGTGQVGVGEKCARSWDPSPAQIHLCRRGPFVTEQLLDPAYRVADPGHERVAVPGVVDRVAHHLRETERTELTEQDHPRVERAWHAGSEQPRTRHQVEAELLEVCDARRGRRRTLAAYYQRLSPFGAVEDDRDLPTRAVEVRLDHLKGQPCGHSRIESVTPGLQYGHASRRGQPVRGGNHAVGTDELRPGGEHAATLGNAVASGDPVLRTDLAPYGFFVAAGFGGVRATGPEPATRRGVHRRRHVAFQDHAFALQLDVGVGDGDRGEQSLGVWVQRVAVELIAGRHLYHHAEVHNPHAVGDVLDHREVVGDEQIGQVPLSLELLHQVDDLRLDRDVQSRDGLVGHDKVGVYSEGPGHPKPLPLSARELVRVAVGVFFAEAHRLQELVHPIESLAIA